MAEGQGAIALYFAHVAAEVLRPRLPKDARVLDFGDLRGRVGEHLRAAGATIVREGAPPFAAAFAEVGEWAKTRARASELASLLVPGAALLIRLRRGPEQPVARVKDDLGPAFSWDLGASLGLVVPGEGQSAWAERYPQAFGFLCALEGALRARPPFRDGGREALLLGTRRAPARAARPGDAT